MIDETLRDFDSRVRTLHAATDGTVQTYLQHVLEAVAKFSDILQDARDRQRTDTREVIHDLRSPLNAMVGFPSMLLSDDHDLTPEQRAEITTIHALARQLDQETLATYSRPPTE